MKTSNLKSAVNATTTPPPNPPDRNNATTNGWDSVFAINFDNANTALTSGWANVNAKAKNISQVAADTPNIKIDGVFDPYQFTVGGDGKNIRMMVPFKSGTYNALGKSYDLAPVDGKAVAVDIEVGMEWVPNPDQKSFVVSGASVAGIVKDLDNNELDAALKAEFTSNKIPLGSDASAVVINAGLEWHVTQKSGKNFYIFHTKDKFSNEFLDVYQYEKSWANNLKFLAQSVSSEQPAVAIITIVNNPTPAGSIAADVFPALLSTWFNDNIAEFNYVFADLDLAPDISKSDKFPWLLPTATSYAVVGEGALDNSIFGVLTMNGNHVPGDNHEVTPYAIPTGPGSNDANAGFLISGPSFVKNMILGGAKAIFDDADDTAFQIINDHLTVQNTKELVWGKFMLDNKNQGNVSNSYAASLDQKNISSNLQLDLQNLGIFLDNSYKVSVTTKGSQWLLSSPSAGSDEYILNLNKGNIEVFVATLIKIQKGGFKMTLIDSYVEIEFIGLSYPYSSDFDVSINYTEQVVLTLKELGGKQIFWFDQVFKNLAVSVKKTKSAITREIVEGAITGLLSLVAIAGPILEGLGTAVEIGDVTAEGGDAIVDAEGFASAEGSDPEGAAEDLQESAEGASSQLKGKLTNIKNAFGTPKWKFAAAMAALGGAVVGIDNTASAIAQAAAQKKWENVPGFDDFANEVIKPYAFPNVESFDLVSAWLAGSLQIGLKTKEKKA